MQQHLKALFVLSVTFCFCLNTQAQFSGWGLKDVMKSSINKKERKTLLGSLEKKKDVVIAMIDSGLQFNHPFIPKNQLFMPSKHPMLPRSQWNKEISANFYGVDFSSKKMTFRPTDIVGHGTHVTGIVKQVFKEAKFLVLKYYDPNGDNTDSSIQALEFAVKCPEVDIINYSGGGPGASAKEKNLIELAKRKGKLLVAAAGNERSNIDFLAYHYYPASYVVENIISVGAHNQKGNIASASNWGSNSVHISAPGKLITSAFIIKNLKKAAGKIKNLLKRVKKNQQHQLAAQEKVEGTYRMTGTSQATAFVSGAAAYLKSRFPSLSMIEIKKVLMNSAHRNNLLRGKNSTQGMLRLVRAIRVAQNTLNPKLKLKKLAEKNNTYPAIIKRSVAKDI